MKKIILGNLITIFVILCILEFTSYLYLKYDAKSYMENYNKFAKASGGELLTQRYAPVRIFNQDEYNFRKTNVGSSEKGSILFFGCSYIYGYLEEEENTIPSIITQETNRTTINRGVVGGSILNTLYDLRNEEFYKNIQPNPDYIMYLYINDHKARIANPYRSSVTSINEDTHYEIDILYKIENGKLKEIKPNKFSILFYNLYITKAWNWLYAYKLNNQTLDEQMYNLFVEAKAITDKKFPNSKFVIIEYKDGGRYLMSDFLRNKLLENKFIVLNAETLAGHELDSEQWRAGDKEHPSSAAFKDVANGLIKEFNL